MNAILDMDMNERISTLNKKNINNCAGLKETERQRVSSEMAVFARALRKFIENFPGQKYTSQIQPIHFDSIFVLIRYSCLFYNNTDFSRFLTRTIDMMILYCEYIRVSSNKNDFISAEEAIQMILHKFVSSTAVNYTIPDEPNSEIISESMMKDIIEIIKVNQNPEIINRIVSDYFTRFYPTSSSISSITSKPISSVSSISLLSPSPSSS
jgi:hypothetical protein